MKSEPGGHGTVAATCQCCRCAVKGCWGSRGRVWAGRKRGGWQAPGRAGGGEYALGGGEYGCCTPQMGWRLGGAGTLRGREGRWFMRCEGAYAGLDVESCSSCTVSYRRPAAARCAEANGPCPLFDGAECRRPCSRPGPSCYICSSGPGGAANDSCAGCDEMVGKSSQLKSRISDWSRLLSLLALFGSALSVA